MMTRNDFELLASALKSERESIEHDQSGYPKDICKTRLQGFSYAVNCVAGVCAASNSRFKRALFMRACGCKS